MITDGPPADALLLPSGWPAVANEVLELALAQSASALAPDVVERRLERYFDPQGAFAGALFNTIPNLSLEPGDPTAEYDITPADILAVVTLNVPVHPIQLRQLLEPGLKRKAVRLALRNIPPNAAIHALDAPLGESANGNSANLLAAMEVLQVELRTSGPSKADGGPGERWVFAAKLAARKRPELFPVRDQVVCKYLSDSHRLATTGVGNFTTDIQVFAHLMTNPDVRIRLNELADHLGRVRGIDGSVSLLRILDVALWMAGRAAGYGVRS